MSCAPLELRAVTCLRDAAAIRDLTVEFPSGTCTLVTGADGDTRDLLLRVAGLVETPDGGDVLLAGRPTRACSDEERAELRSQQLGFVFRAPFLLPAFSVVENVAMPLFRRSHVDATEAGERTGELLRFVGLIEAAEERIENLPLAARHAVSLARALVNRPAVLLVEDLDGELEEDDLRAFRMLLREACARFAIAVIASTSGPAPIEGDARVLRLGTTLEQGSSLLS